MKDNRGTHFVEAGLDCWIHGKTSMTGGYLHHQYEMDEMKIAACAYWKSENVLMMEWRYPEMAFLIMCPLNGKKTGIYETLGEYEFTGTGKTSCNSKNMRILTIIKKTIGVSVR